jgi:hypothetical protein
MVAMGILGIHGYLKIPHACCYFVVGTAVLIVITWLLAWIPSSVKECVNKCLVKRNRKMATQPRKWGAYPPDQDSLISSSNGDGRLPTLLEGSEYGSEESFSLGTSGSPRKWRKTKNARCSQGIFSASLTLAVVGVVLGLLGIFHIMPFPPTACYALIAACTAHALPWIFLFIPCVVKGCCENN